jgi:ribulose 1,5-bisphosphate synthetase/thiazole synthase
MSQQRSRLRKAGECGARQVVIEIGRMHLPSLFRTVVRSPIKKCFSRAAIPWLMAGMMIFSNAAQAEEAVYVDVCVYGATSGGVVAAVKAARLGKRVALICDKNHVGGMTSSGLGWTDVGHVETAYIQGMASEFYTRINSKYGTDVNYHFEPHVAESVFNEMIQESGVILYTNQYVVSVTNKARKSGPSL